MRGTKPHYHQQNSHHHPPTSTRIALNVWFVLCIDYNDDNGDYRHVLLAKQIINSTNAIDSTVSLFDESKRKRRWVVGCWAVEGGLDGHRHLTRRQISQTHHWPQSYDKHQPSHNKLIEEINF